MAVAVLFAYLALVLYVGVFAFRSKVAGADAEEFFVAGRSLGPVVFLLSLFGANMTAFSILGASGHAFANGIVTFGLMASSSALVIPLSFFLIGTRLWMLGKRHGFLTPVQLFRDRWECRHIGTVIFVVQAGLLIPYIIIAVVGGGTTVAAVTNGAVPYWAGGAIVSLVIMGYVFFGGMRGTAWVNTVQSVFFLLFGSIAIIAIARGMGGFQTAIASILDSPKAYLLSRERVSPAYFFSYMFIPLSSIAFPHIAIFCMTARRLAHFKPTIVLYPLCMLAIWLPSVFLGVMANGATGLGLRGGDDVILRLVQAYAPPLLSALLGAAVLAAVMASDSQILALSTMFANDVFAYYGGSRRFGARAQVLTARVFVVLVTLVAYAVALTAPVSIFAIATQYAFAGYAALTPLLIGALFWKGSTRWGALASTVWVAAAVIGIAVLQSVVPAPPPGQAITVLSFGDAPIVTRAAAGTLVWGMLPVVPVTIVSAVLMYVVSRLTPAARPDGRALARYF
jgi:SSS family solute:Na+ symporter